VKRAECQELIEAYLTWLRENYETDATNGVCRISTPLLDRHNDALEILVERNGRRLRLTDGGDTISDLNASGMEFNTPKRKEVLESILNGFGVHLDPRDSALFVTSAFTDLGQKKHNLLQAMLAVNDMFVMSREHVLSFFKEDVAFAVSDVRAVRPEPLLSLALLDDEAESPNPEHIDALRAYDIEPLFWSEKEAAIPLLNGG